MKLLKSEWIWFVTINLMLITIYYGILHVHPSWFELTNFKAAVLSKVPKVVKTKAHSISGQKSRLNITNLKAALFGTAPDGSYFTSGPTVFKTKDLSISGQKPSRLDRPNLKAAVIGRSLSDAYYIPRPTVVNAWNQDLSINGQNICKQTRPYLLLLVLTIPKNAKQRDAIRETWTKPKNWPNFKIPMTIKTVFLFGKFKDNKANSLVVDENAKHGDIVVGNFVDSYRNLSIKVLTGLSWVRRYCADAKFVAKLDDDTFINIPLLYEHLQAKPQLNYTILGYPVNKAPCIRVGKYYVSPTSYPFKFYPPHTKGNLYIATSETFFALLDVAPYQPRIEMEDVYITGILAKVAKVRHRAYPPGMYNPLGAVPACEFVKDTKLISQGYDDKRTREAMKLIKDPRGKCK